MAASYVSSFKKFMKTAEKETAPELEVGANPAVEEQVTPAAPVAPPNTAPKADIPVAPPSIEANPAVIATRQAAAAAIANRDKVISDKQAELDKLKAAQDALVNTANTNLNKALQDAGKAANPTT